MSWWWWKSANPADADSEPNSTTHSQDHRSIDASTTPQVSRDQQAFNELKDLFGRINPEAAARAASTAKELAEKADRAAAENPFASEDDSLYPSTMSCSQCFDLAYYCSSIGGQLNNIYRYGGMRSCSDLWAQWRFCMRTKAMDADTARIKIREWNQKKVAKYKLGRSSEDVWKVRKEPLENPFSKNPDVE